MPPLTHHSSHLLTKERVIEDLIADPELDQLLSRIASREKEGISTHLRASKILKEMVADPDPKVIAFSYRIYRWLWSRLFRNLYLEPSHLERLRQAIGQQPVVLTPSHKSHWDYMLLSALFHEQSFPTPHIAAGINLSFWPIGMLFRKNGAYFIRRALSVDLLYARLLGAYIRSLIRRGQHQEIFIEGGRSRNGKLIRPKQGILTMQMEAYFMGVVADFYMLPVSINYDRILEERAFEEELSGKAKERETFLLLLKSWRLLKKSHGDVHVRIAEPISISRFVNANRDKLPPKARKEKTEQLAKEIVQRIANHTAVTPTALFACAVLSQTSSVISDEDLQSRLETLCTYFNEVGAPIAPTIQPLSAFMEQEKQNWFPLTPEHRVRLDYYKNTVLHYLVPHVIHAFSDDPRTQEWIQNILFHEFFYAKERTSSVVRPECKPLLASLVINFLESHLIATQGALTESLISIPEDDALQRTMELGRQMLNSRKVERPESISTLNLKSAFEFLYERKMLGNKEALLAHLRRIVEKLHT